MAQDIEIELKFPLLNADTVADFLNKNGKFKYENTQHDIYYNHPSRDFLKNNDNVTEWLRIRVSGNEAEINYKDWQPHDAKIKTHCIEFETTVASFDQLNKLLNALGFAKMIEVKKSRRSWMFDDVEISIDNVDELGSYIELEYKGRIDNVDKAREHLYKTLKQLGAETGNLDLKGYPYLLLQSKGLLG
jgi:adenylate cyclase, class 2